MDAVASPSPPPKRKRVGPRTYVKMVGWKRTLSNELVAAGKARFYCGAAPVDPVDLGEYPSDDDVPRGTEVASTLAEAAGAPVARLHKAPDEFEVGDRVQVWQTAEGLIGSWYRGECVNDPNDEMMDVVGARGAQRLRQFSS